MEAIPYNRRGAHLEFVLMVREASSFEVLVEKDKISLLDEKPDTRMKSVRSKFYLMENESRKSRTRLEIDVCYEALGAVPAFSA